MSIQYFEKENIFLLNTPKTSYIIGIFDEEQFLGHLYYGKRITNIEGIHSLARTMEPPFVPSKNDRDRSSFFDAFPFEYSSHGVGDFRESSLKMRTKDGHTATSLVYVSHVILRGKRKLEGLPATFGQEDEVETLEIICVDPVTNVRAILSYSVFSDCDAIARSVRVVNDSDQPLYMERVMSACFDLEGRDFDVLTLHGSWARERHMERKPLGHGIFGVASLRGESSHQEHPFIGLLSKNADQTSGEVYGFHFVYSGNFLAQAQRNQFGQVRVLMGIHPEEFCWKLEPGESFQAPEVISVYSDQGLGGMTRTLHDLYREHLIRSPWLHKKRPILINNWEATYFDFTSEKIVDIAKESARLGIEMLVLDDGWFGNRFDDNRALGDWQVNEEKITGGMGKLSDEIHAQGMKFGLWFEPEMISPESKLFKEHPDWAIQVPDRRPCRARNQLVLDISRKEVRDHILSQVFAVLHAAKIEYVKWDMNRPLSDLGSAALSSDRQGELMHRYVLGMYEMQERLLQEFPELLLENCSGGGGRFDPGMLYFSPQIWCSDDTDAIERLSIQEGTALLYPLSCMGAHVSVCPNHTVGRSTPFATRGMVALAGTFGYELDITKLSEEDKTAVQWQTRTYHAFNDLVREGKYYRVQSYAENHDHDCFMVTNAKADKALVFFTQVLATPNMRSRCIRLQGLKEEANYRIQIVNLDKEEQFTDTGKVVSGGILMNAGMIVERPWGDFQARLYYLEEI
ncbi:MAG: alpha-galactosidase [Lachnospiraceae bacterium]|nr:alpha-galactosidase [Lachnospiraceae bacterium]